MIHFIPAWYQKNNWCEDEQYWYAPREHSEMDDTVKYIQLFHRSNAYPFQIMLLSFAPNFRHFLHRQSVFHAPYWSCFDAIQGIKKKKVRMFSFHNLRWPENIEFVYSPFAIMGFLHGKKHAQIEFGEDGNLIQVDLYQNEQIQRRNIYDDRGFVGSTIVYDEGKPVYQDYLSEKGIWKLRFFYEDGHVEMNPKEPTYLLECDGEEQVKNFAKLRYDTIEEVIFEVLTSYVTLLDDKDLFCVAMHNLHIEILKEVLKNKKIILSFFENRYDMKKYRDNIDWVLSADYLITDSQENLKKVNKCVAKRLTNIIDITPFDSRVDFGISLQLDVQKILVPVDGLGEEKFDELMVTIAKYLLENENARIHLFTRNAQYGRKKELLERVRKVLTATGFNETWAFDENEAWAENQLDVEEREPVRFVVEQCVDELSVAKCLREQRLIVDMRNSAELYLRISGISMGIPQIVYKSNQFVIDGKNGRVIKNMEQLPDAIAFYLDSLTNWNEAMVNSYEIGKKYTTTELIDRWKEVINIVG